MDSMIAYIMIVAIVIVGVGLVVVVGTPIIDNVKSNLEFREAEDFLSRLDSSIKEVAIEGEGSSRIIKSSSGDFRVGSNENLVEFSQRSDVFDYLTRKIYNNMILISGTDANCYEADMNNDGRKDLVMENSYITVALSKVGGAYDTKDNIIMLKNNAISIVPMDSSIVVDGDPATSSGNGVSYLERIGQDMPKCRAHFSMNSTVSYDIYYTLYSGADFLSVDVRNVR